MQTQREIKELLAARGLSPKKSLGQNFLVDQNLLTKLVDAADLREGDLVLEVGPGTGTLTEAILARGCRVVAGELDDGLADLLAERFEAEAAAGRFTLVRGDCLADKRTLSAGLSAALAGRPFSHVANLPYHAATPLLLALLTAWPLCSTLAVTIQAEVADRLAASPGDDAYGAISAVRASVAEIRRVGSLPASCFWPQPGVASAMVVLRRLATPLTDEPAKLGAFCQDVFSLRRKQLGVALRTLGRTPEAWPEGVRPEDRAEALPLDRLIALERACRRP